MRHHHVTHQPKRHSHRFTGSRQHPVADAQLFNTQVRRFGRVLTQRANMLNFDDCRYRAELRLAQLQQECGDELVLSSELHETERTLAIFYQSANYLSTGEAKHALAGNGPILVSKLTRAVGIAGTALPVEASIRDFETDSAKSA